MFQYSRLDFISKVELKNARLGLGKSLTLLSVGLVVGPLFLGEVFACGEKATAKVIHSQFSESPDKLSPAKSITVAQLSSDQKKVKTTWGDVVSKKDMPEISLAKAVASASNSEVAPSEMIVTGKAEKVCKKKGCWMTVVDGDTSVRVTFKDYGFFVDESLLGKRMRARGVLKLKKRSKAEEKHFLIDEGMSRKKADKFAKSKKNWEFVAAGVEIL